MPEPATQPRTLTEDEAYAIAADRVTRETAALSAQVETLTGQVGELQSKLDVSEAALATEKASREAAEKSLVDYKADVERQREVAARREERAAKVREIAGHLKDDFYTDARLDRWAQMDDEAFQAWCSELREMVPATAGASTEPPRETAMRGSAANPPAAEGNARRLFEIRKGA